MILGFKQTFPDKTPTGFESKIITLEKIHSIRKGHRWHPGMSIQMAFGVRTKNYRQFNKGIETLSKCIHVQDIFMTYERWGALEITVNDDNYLLHSQIETLIKHDGLTRKQFIDWFFAKDTCEFSGQIIHWTDFKY